MNAARTWIAIAWTVYVVAWFLPVVEGGSKFLEGVPGWEALMISLAPLWDRTLWENPSMAALFALSGLTNLVMMGSWVAVMSRWRAGLRAVAVAGLASLLVNSHWFFRHDRDLHLKIGYYLWWGSFLPLAIGAFLLRRRLATASE